MLHDKEVYQLAYSAYLEVIIFYLYLFTHPHPFI
jgi:hypothetical protein